MRGLLVVALCLLASASSAGLVDDSIPPVRYWSDFTVTLVTVPPNIMNQVCGWGDRRDVQVNACYIDKINTIVMPSPCGAAYVDQTAKLLCHEGAHVHGWPADHPR